MVCQSLDKDHRPIALINLVREAVLGESAYTSLTFECAYHASGVPRREAGKTGNIISKIKNSR